MVQSINYQLFFITNYVQCTILFFFSDWSLCSTFRGSGIAGSDVGDSPACEDAKSTRPGRTGCSAQYTFYGDLCNKMGDMGDSMQQCGEVGMFSWHGFPNTMRDEKAVFGDGGFLWSTLGWVVSYTTLLFMHMKGLLYVLTS